MVCERGRSDTIGSHEHSDVEETSFLVRDISHIGSHGDALAQNIDDEFPPKVSGAKSNQQRLLRENAGAVTRSVKAPIEQKPRTAAEAVALIE